MGLGVCGFLATFTRPEFIFERAMKRNTITLLLLLFSFSLLSAQSGLEGVWKGVITVGGLDEGARQLPFELYLQKEGKKLVGRSYITYNSKKRIEMEVHGTLYGDLSIYIKDTQYVPEPGKEEERPQFFRMYQLMYMPSIWNTKMEGFWQEITPHYFSEKRRLGRIKLKKIKNEDKA